MTIQELYERIDGSYDDVLKRIPSEDLIRYFVRKFMSDRSYAELMSAIEKGDVKKSFEASHKLKGLVANLGFVGLYDAVYSLTEHLRSDPKAIDPALAEKVSDCYNIVAKGIQEYENESD